MNITQVFYFYEKNLAADDENGTVCARTKIDDELITISMSESYYVQQDERIYQCWDAFKNPILIDIDATIKFVSFYNPASSTAPIGHEGLVDEL